MVDFYSTAPQGPFVPAQSRKNVESSSVGSLRRARLWGFRIPDSRFRIPGSFPSGIGNLESGIPIGLRPNAALGGRQEFSDPGSGCRRPLSKGNRGCRIESRMGRDRTARGVSPENASPILWRSTSPDGATSPPARRGVMPHRRGSPEGREPSRAWRAVPGLRPRALRSRPVGTGRIVSVGNRSILCWTLIRRSP